jgi:hypothetical protein
MSGNAIIRLILGNALFIGIRPVTGPKSFTCITLSYGIVASFITGRRQRPALDARCLRIASLSSSPAISIFSLLSVTSQVVKPLTFSILIVRTCSLSFLLFRRVIWSPKTLDKIPNKF